jgi:hypothetical protein
MLRTLRYQQAFSIRIKINNIPHFNSKGFWQWCIALGRIMFLDFVHPLTFLKAQRFGNWICWPSHWTVTEANPFKGTQQSRGHYYFTLERKQIQFPKQCVFRNIRWGTKSKNMILPNTTPYFKKCWSNRKLINSALWDKLL